MLLFLVPDSRWLRGWRQSVLRQASSLALSSLNEVLRCAQDFACGLLFGFRLTHARKAAQLIAGPASALSFSGGPNSVPTAYQLQTGLPSAQTVWGLNADG